MCNGPADNKFSGESNLLYQSDNPDRELILFWELNYFLHKIFLIENMIHSTEGLLFLLFLNSSLIKK